MIERAGRMGRVLWLAFWPWMFYEAAAQAIWLLFVWYIGEMGVMLLSLFLISAALYPVYRYREAESPESGSRAAEEPNTGKYLAVNWLLLAVTAVSACVFLNMLLILSGISRLSASYEEVGGFLYSAPFWQQLLVMGFSAPVTEELIFRGLGYGTFRKSMKMGQAAVLSAIFFGVFHGNLVQGIYAGGLGVLLAFAYEYGQKREGKNGGLKAAIWFHIWANFASIVLNTVVSCLPELSSSLWFSLFLLAAGGTGSIRGIFRMLQNKRA